MTEPASCPTSERKRKPDDVGEGEGGSLVKHAKCVQSLDKGAMTILQGGHTIVQALENAQQVLQHTVALSKEELAAVDQKYYAGIQTGVDTSMMDAFSTLKKTMEDLQAIGSSISSKKDNTPIHKLPAELLFEVFGSLDTEALFSCQQVCRKWRKLLKSNAAYESVWVKAMPAIHCTIAQLDKKWYRLNCRLLSKLPERLSLTIHQSPSDRKESDYALRERLKKTKWVANFPEWLVEFKFDGQLRCADTKLWDLVAKCNSLQVLHWKSHGRPDSDFKETFRYDIGEGSALTDCKIQEFLFDVTIGVRIDAAFVHMLREVKRLYLICGLEALHLTAILSLSESSLEELTVVELGWRSEAWYGSEPRLIKTEFVMDNLQKITLHDAAVGILNITAPNATSVRYDDIQLIDWTLLDSCRKSIKSLHLQLNSCETKGRLAQEFFDMPELESLHIDYESQRSVWNTRDELGPVASFSQYSTASFWTAVMENNLDKLKNSLPRLKQLTIIHDPLLDADLFVKYINIRKTLNQPALQDVTLSLANHLSKDTSALDGLRVAMPSFSYKLFDEWGVKEKTEEWQLMTTLDYSYGSIDWNLLKACNMTLKNLTICVRDWDEDKRLERELFAMPELEELEVDFSSLCSQVVEASLKALWKAFVTEGTSNDTISLKNILPKLKKFTITNDAELDEDKIVKFFAMREALGFESIESMTVDLARKCSEEVTKLQSLQEHISGFSFKRFEEWTESVQKPDTK